MLSNEQGRVGQAMIGSVRTDGNVAWSMLTKMSTPRFSGEVNPCLLAFS